MHFSQEHIASMNTLSGFKMGCYHGDSCSVMRRTSVLSPGGAIGPGYAYTPVLGARTVNSLQ